LVRPFHALPGAKPLGTREGDWLAWKMTVMKLPE